MDVEKKKTFLVYFLIITAHLLVFLYWANEKENFYIDELFSLGYASNFTGTGDTARYLTESPEWKFDEWVSNAEYQKYLRVSEQEELLRLPVGTAIKKAITGRNYFALLNIVETIAGTDRVTHWPAVLLNMIFFVIADIALIALLKKLCMDDRSRYLALAMFGFCGFVISLVLYIRFYMLVVALFLLMLNVFYRMWMTTKLRYYILFEMVLFILAFLSFKDSELTAPFFCAISFVFLIALIMTKQWKKVAALAGPAFAGLIVLCFGTDFLSILAHPELSDNYVLTDALTDMRNANLVAVKDHIKWVVKLMLDNYFGSYLIVILAALSLLLFFLNKTDGSKGERTGERWVEISLDRVKIRQTTFAAAIIWCLLFATSLVLKKGWLLCLAALVIYVIMTKYGTALWKRMKVISRETAFVLIIAGGALIYTMFTAAAAFGTWRYYCFGFISITVIFWYGLDRVLKHFAPQALHKGMYLILLVCVALSALIPFRVRNPEYIYEEDESFRKRLEQYRETDTVLLSSVNEENGYVSRVETYDCVALMSESARIYAVDLNSIDTGKLTYPDSFILWTAASRDISAVLDELSKSDYQIEEIGTGHASQAFLCRMK